MTASTSIYMLLNNEFTHDTRVEREAMALIEAGHTVTVFCSNKRSHQTPLPAKENRHGIKIQRIFPKRFNTYRALSIRQLQAFVSLVFSQPKPSAIHAHDSNTLLLGWFLAKWWKVPLVYDSHEYWASMMNSVMTRIGTQLQDSATPDSEVPSLFARIKQLRQVKAFETRLMRDCAAIISVNQSILERITAGLDVPKPQQRLVIRNIPPRFSLSPEALAGPNKLKHTLSLPDNSKIVLFQGGITRPRGIFQLLESMPILRNTIPNAVLVLMGSFGGDDSLESAIIDWMDTHPGMAAIQPAVPPAELLSWTAGADVGVTPYLNTHENHYLCMPNKLFEYIQADLPQAVSDFPELRGIVSGYGVGETFDPADSASIAAALSTVLSQPQGYYQGNLQAAKAALNWEQESQGLVALYRQLLKTP
jgi:glycosyltransferase involved in cell wall biosynthesis